jgi:hypothetical protein
VKTGDFFYFRTDRRHTFRAHAKTEMITIGFGTGFLPARRG